ncbi:HAMP domain-containing methyl-accepting chemotaxis protein [Thauera mechernichensis]
MIGTFDRSVSARLLLLVAALVAALLVVGALGIRGMSQSNTGLETVYQDRVVPLRDLKVIADVYAVNIVDTAHKVRDGIITWPQARRNLDEANNTIEQKWREYTATYLVDEERRLVAEIEPMLKDSAAVLGRLKDILIKEDRAAIAAFSAGPLYPTIDPISEKFSQLIDIQLDVAGREYQQSAASYKATRNANIAIVVIGLVAGIGLALWIVRSITVPLAKLQDTIVNVEYGGDLTLRVGAAGKDEVGRTAAAFDKMMMKIATLVGDMRQTADAIATAAQSMATVGAQVEKRSGAQSEAVSAIAAAVEQTSVSISETASNARNADETATTARSDIDTTLAAVREATQNVHTLAGMIEEASSDIAHLAESSRKIDGIVNTIKEIADQTNLLALNAAIEAARAGEQGRGFAVVADEVRKLAENTTKATDEISNLIGRVQSEVDRAVARMQQANKRAGTTRDGVVASTGRLDAASANTAQVTESVLSIALAVREQDVAVLEVAQRMEQIAQMTQENTLAAGSAAETARQLDGLAGKLHEAVSRFKV